MKGVILAGGKGTRLLPITKVTNKHLLAIYNKPMIYYPLGVLTSSGIKDILIVTGPEHAGHFLNLLGSGKEFGVRISYEVQEEAGGIAQALSLAEDFADEKKIAVILGDNIFEKSLSNAIRKFQNENIGAKIFLKEVEEANRFGVAEIKNGKLVGIEEKPKAPKSRLAVTGMYMYDKTVFEKIKKLKPSHRGELEITDVNNMYLKSGDLSYEIINGKWTDAGTFSSMLKASILVANMNNVDLS
ncbi:spore coat protein [Candidatus Giovannonibacteria bacterium RIFCSPLOWO2_02_FULL_43_11b]|uniref:glucose-1-phosphate thymidylyltransferase n=1 Tax=Candidatus Giovannonibacteria bacterium RIFCSPHIGHO2_12_FULL_43_15 TaxID=1798341 RepID=A0A1F5WP83_9BACT|nr:MAG: spore coat protein [Candidatus Giovannonibacteria bacterium RIFCSPHIGHO2_01_FULL_43_100]OGF66465.1 MAG: spore coat protein [Candidatus Giovannonibacteria bacterium RIFCSPHIGHO2_02_FULL_43_32]OGF77414.1 MAG: spore coat protein [Candidatus Giovannonibacteria bacterium RIFCSPHIGHO2_12_FULL_43_15]OGF78436.1 MAG: spore coat protein [Candidatus Giovannonibacteria bacterium RIFCSPLOWO2_01_FULL_43_60]OGF89797.1 MAG: spore coat protein [Candidatus Giovannonibacteria bacterium RIFCSPLOWO2_02_FULL